MIIQSAPSGQARLAISMHDHGHLSGQFARAFGNSEFEPPAPLELVAYAIANHDAGWAAFDADPVTDPDTGVPYSVFGTPGPHILPTSKASPDFNQLRHPYCGLLSSMHTWEIYNGRYGVSSSGRLDRIAPSDRPAVDEMLAGEQRRQKLLKHELAGSPETAAWIEDGILFQNYKLLQFCDLLALYFNTADRNSRKPQEFTHVPTSRSADISVRVEPREGTTYTVTPFPFSYQQAEFAFPGKPVSPGDDARRGGWKAHLQTTPCRWEIVRLVPG